MKDRLALVAKGMTPCEIAARLGAKSATIRKYLDRNHIPYKRVGSGGTQNGLPVLCRGVTYLSQADCARALGVAKAVVWNALERGTIDNCGLRKFA